MKTYLLTDEMQIIGRAGEQDGVTLAVDVSEWQEEYSDGVGTMLCTRPDGKQVPVSCTVDDTLLKAVLPDECLSRPGVYQYTANWVEAGTVQKSQIYKCIVLSTENGRGLPPDCPGTPAWATEIFVKAEQIDAALDASMQMAQYAEDAEAARDEAVAAEAVCSEVLDIVNASEETIAAMREAADGIEEQKDTMIASIAAIAEMGTDPTLTQTGVAADAKATGDNLEKITDETVNEFYVTDRTNRSINGVQFTFHDDGSFTAVGTASGTVNLYIMGDTISTANHLGAGTYTFTRWTTEGSGNVRLRNATASTNILTGTDAYLTSTLTLTGSLKISIQIGNGVTVNGTFRFQIEKSGTASEYQPALSALDAEARMRVTELEKAYRTSQNLFYVTDRKNRTINGVDFTFNEDGSFTASGTATATINVYIMGDGNASTARLPAGTYTFTRWITDGSGNVRLRNGSDESNIITGTEDYITNTLTLGSATKISIQIGNDVSVNGTFRFQIEAGSTATEYAPCISAVDAVARMKHEELDSEYKASQKVHAVYRDDLVSSTYQGASEGLFVSAGGARYALVHSVVENKNCDCWRIYRALSEDEKKSVTMNGEWECALRMSGWSDFCGGYAHGNEVLVYENDVPCITFYADGISKSLSDMADGIECYELKIQEATVLYNNLDPTSAVANHGREYVFSSDGLIIRQSIEWLTSGTLNRCYLAMLPTAKVYAEKFYTDTEYKMTELPEQDDYDYTYAGARRAQIYGSKADYDFSITEYPTGLTGGDTLLVTDNYISSTTMYHKFYFRVCNGGTIEQGTVWKSETKYSIKYIN